MEAFSGISAPSSLRRNRIQAIELNLGCFSFDLIYEGNKKNGAPYEWIALRCQAGEMSAFEDLVAAAEGPLLYYASSLTGNQDSGLDVLQEPRVKVLRDIRKLKDPGSLRS
jgi:hypothetical protein